MPNWFWMILLQVVLILLNAVFAGSEIAVLSVNEFKLKKMVENGNKRAVKLQKLSEEPSRFLSTIQIAITLSGFLGSAFAADNFSGALADWMVSLGVPLSYSALDTISVILITIILSYFTLVFGELVPKQIAIHRSEQMALAVSGLISSIAVIFSPLVKVLTWSTNAVLTLFGIQSGQEEEVVSEEEIIMMVSAGEEKGTIDTEEKELISNVFAFDDLEARELMTHRTGMISLDLEDPDSWEQTIYDSERSMIPVYEDEIDHMVGVLNTKKYFRQPRSLSEKERIIAAMEPPYFVWESIKADDLFNQMKRDRQNMAIVLDEYGGVSGLVTLNDLVQELVGEFEEDQKDIEKLPDGSFRILGRASIQDVARTLDASIDPDLVTFNGLVYHLMQSVPENGSHLQIPFGKWSITLEKVTNHRVESALVSPLPQAESEEPAKAAEDKQK